MGSNPTADIWPMLHSANTSRDIMQSCHPTQVNSVDQISSIVSCADGVYALRAFIVSRIHRCWRCCFRRECNARSSPHRDCPAVRSDIVSASPPKMQSMLVARHQHDVLMSATFSNIMKYKHDDCFVYHLQFEMHQLPA